MAILPAARTAVGLIERCLHLLTNKNGSDEDWLAESPDRIEKNDAQELLDLYSGHHTLRQILHCQSTMLRSQDSRDWRGGSADLVPFDSETDIGNALLSSNLDDPSYTNEMAGYAGGVRCEFPILEAFNQLFERDPSARLQPFDVRGLTRDLSLSEEWEVPVLIESDHNFHPLLVVGFQFLAPYLSWLNVSEETLCNLLWYLENLYIKNPYHNAKHAAQVMHSSTWIARTVLGPEWSVLDKISLAISSLAHDVGHPARTNGFLCAMGSPLALLYNDISVLENYHCSLLFNVLAIDHCNVFAFTEQKDVFFFRRFAIRAIIATDMSRHFELLTQSRLKLVPRASDSTMIEDDRLFLYSLILKAGDLSHTAVSWRSHKQWADRVKEEFFQQGDIEKSNGVPISPLCDRSQNTDAEYAKSQVSFIHFVAQPLYSVIESLDHSGKMRSHCLHTIERNREKWELHQHDLVTGLTPPV
eukprot:Protomagalhaensia_sp_Gyna_25__5558@NODE_759_length_2681_cov_81_228993_g595_i0_p1_GENE_NODE_759_length_2681_cov_81_228993_g595_i0NODE_759_length_2681_cov_81_228993_g595_i0_p1_ORF_typecomplete_len472_score87_61PDEase_I/PF00233_19/9_1e68HD/PF01966_22/5_3e03HD/PF01966_22/0_32_NODE_759_length_2681_cov_81_228993_g595_i06032018